MLFSWNLPLHLIYWYRFIFRSICLEIIATNLWRLVMLLPPKKCSTSNNANRYIGYSRPFWKTAPQVQHAGLSQVQHYTLNLPKYAAPRVQSIGENQYQCATLNLSGLLHTLKKNIGLKSGLGLENPAQSS